MTEQAGQEGAEAPPAEAAEEASLPARAAIPTMLLPNLGEARRVVESVIIAVITSTGLYLVGTVYTESYFGRMSIDAASLDLAPPFIALQSTHVVQSLLEYPGTFLLFYLIYRFILSNWQWWRTWYAVVHQRLGRLFLLIVNLLVVSPLVVAAIQAGDDLGAVYASSVLSEVSELMEKFGVATIAYVLWLSFGPRLLILTEIRQRKLIPIGLLFGLYLFDSLIATSHGAAFDAELLMTGASDSAIAVTFTLADDARTTLPESGQELILAIARGGNYYVVERQPNPPSTRPVSYVVTSSAVDMVRLQRINEADVELAPDIVVTVE